MTPEILRTPLHELVLSVLLLKLGHPQSFLNKALEVPPLTSINEAFTLLKGKRTILVFVSILPDRVAGYQW